MDKLSTSVFESAIRAKEKKATNTREEAGEECKIRHDCIDKPCYENKMIDLKLEMRDSDLKNKAKVANIVKGMLSKKNIGKISRNDDFMLIFKPSLEEMSNKEDLKKKKLSTMEGIFFRENVNKVSKSDYSVQMDAVDIIKVHKSEYNSDYIQMKIGSNYGGNKEVLPQGVIGCVKKQDASNFAHTNTEADMNDINVVNYKEIKSRKAEKKKKNKRKKETKRGTKSKSKKKANGRKYRKLKKIKKRKNQGRVNEQERLYSNFIVNKEKCGNSNLKIPNAEAQSYKIEIPGINTGITKSKPTNDRCNGIDSAHKHKVTDIANDTLFHGKTDCQMMRDYANFHRSGEFQNVLPNFFIKIGKTDVFPKFEMRDCAINVVKSFASVVIANNKGNYTASGLAKSAYIDSKNSAITCRENFSNVGTKIVGNATFWNSNHDGNENEGRKWKNFDRSVGQAISCPSMRNSSVKKTIGGVLSSVGMTGVTWWIISLIRFGATDFITKIGSTIGIKATSVILILIGTEIASFGLTVIGSVLLFEDFEKESPKARW